MRQAYKRAICAAAVLMWMGSVFASYGQVNTGTISGTATDPSGATIPNVKVTVVQTETNFESRAETNSEGLYRVQSLLPGPYRVTFEGAGFKRVVQSGIDLRVGDVLPVNVKLEIGQVTESVQVSATDTLLQTETSSTGSLTEGDAENNTAAYVGTNFGSRNISWMDVNLHPGYAMNLMLRLSW